MKRYLVWWRSANHADNFKIECDNFGELGNVILKAAYPPIECPTIFTKIEMIDIDDDDDEETIDEE